MALDLVGIAIILAALSGLPALMLRRRPRAGQTIPAVMMVAGAACALTGAIGVLLGGPGGEASLIWPAAGDSPLGLDPLGAFFLVPVFLVAALGAVYGLGYWPQAIHKGEGARLRVFWGLLPAGMGLLLVARHALAFILGWELMAIAAFFLVTAEDRNGEARRAGYVYIVATHVGTLALFALFALWNSATGSFLLRPAAAGSVDPGTMWAMFLLALLAFGLKAGAMPLHFWLPGAHAAAPSNVSAMLSGVVLKMGVYGLLRFSMLLPDPPAAWGAIVLILGAASSLLGVAFAIAQHDLKRLLAYHSVENIGIILMGLGMAMLGRAAGDATLTLLGMGACLLHVWNHALFKSLLFLAAGAAVRAARTRDVERLGGLGKRMPLTAALFALGAVAICGLPPLNGFVSELLAYLGFFGAAAGSIAGAAGPASGGLTAVALGAPVLAATGALALACFVKAYGAAFLGEPRSLAAAGAREAPLSMTVPMAVLGSACLAIGLAPGLFAPLLDRAIASWNGAALPGIAAASPLAALGIAGPVLLAAIAAVALVARIAGKKPARGPTWDCGYARPTARMQYTASSFAGPIARLYAWALRPREERPAVEGPFPAAAAYDCHVGDPVLDRAIPPASRGLRRLAEFLRGLQQGTAQRYIAFSILALVALLATLIPFRQIWASLWAR